MTAQRSPRLLAVLLLAAVSATGAVCCNRHTAGRTAASDTFETVRAHVQNWISETREDRLLISPSTLKEAIVDDWAHQRDRCQIVSVRTPDDYLRAGHIPNATNIYWAYTVEDSSLARLDAGKEIILYCYYGHASMLSCAILSLLGYRCRSLDFGMMAWNADALAKAPWDRKADYEVELVADSPGESYAPPVLPRGEGDARSLIKQMAQKYLSGEGSPVIASSDVRAIIDDWDHKKAEYQLVDVRSKADYEAGHVPHSVNIPWPRIARRENLTRLDPGRTAIVVSENGQTGQLATTVLSLLGYLAVDMKFGMMDWNSRYVERSKVWAGAAGYPVERTPPGAPPRR